MSNMIKLHFLLGEAMSIEPENYQQKPFFRKSCIRYTQNIDQEMNF